mmetsp:Transcript_13001/g.28840  ORF Transcript_13001/g.28840 Transcript_13001/m.28840 type:complete len:448 (+) Transcript_13001:87-1430(+)
MKNGFPEPLSTVAAQGASAGRAGPAGLPRVRCTAASTDTLRAPSHTELLSTPSTTTAEHPRATCPTPSAAPIAAAPRISVARSPCTPTHGTVASQTTSPDSRESILGANSSPARAAPPPARGRRGAAHGPRPSPSLSVSKSAGPTPQGTVAATWSLCNPTSHAKKPKSSAPGDRDRLRPGPRTLGPKPGDRNRSPPNEPTTPLASRPEGLGAAPTAATTPIPGPAAALDGAPTSATAGTLADPEESTADSAPAPWAVSSLERDLLLCKASSADRGACARCPAGSGSLTPASDESSRQSKRSSSSAVTALEGTPSAARRVGDAAPRSACGPGDRGGEYALGSACGPGDRGGECAPSSPNSSHDADPLHSSHIARSRSESSSKSMLASAVAGDKHASLAAGCSGLAQSNSCGWQNCSQCWKDQSSHSRPVDASGHCFLRCSGFSGNSKM